MKRTPRVERILAAAEDDAQRRGHNFVGTEHLLLALIGDPDGIAGQVIAQCGIAEQVVRRVEDVFASPHYLEGSTDRYIEKDGKFYRVP